MSDNSHSDLIAQLEERTTFKKAGKAYKAEYGVWDIPDLKIVRWKFNEYDYYSPEKAKLPITARGLYTLDGRIIVRGYDKFFNMNEVKTTKTEYLQTKLQGPYFATVKENGCLVLIAGHCGKLIVTSKNSSGPNSTFNGKNHALIAREWVLKHLKSSKKSEKEFADLLEQNNWTAVGEVCDDSFEEHVLPYHPDAAGIYLNGLNHNDIVFSTEPPAKVNEISREFGFRLTEFVEFSTFEDLMEFLESKAKTGKWNDREVEGFVIRCKTLDSNRDFFWKFKFEEPYLMYREWREVVKEFLDHGLDKALARAKRSRHAQSSLKFLQFAANFLDENKAFRERLHTQNLGIIELRSKFFAAAEANEQMLLGLDTACPKFLLVTVATLGCGKSTVSRALVYLMNNQWGHCQNDFMKGKGKKFDLLCSAITEKMLENDVVILDKNNCELSERQKIFDSFDNIGHTMGFDIKYICLNFLPLGPSEDTNTLTRQRVFARGDNHQTVKMSVVGEKGINAIMKNFENRFQIVNECLSPDKEFDSVINLAPGESVSNVQKVLSHIREKYSDRLNIPDFSKDQIENAVAQAMSEDNGGSAVQCARVKRIEPAIRINYFGVQIDEENYKMLLDVARKMLADIPDGHWLERINVQDSFHLTLAHRNSHKPRFDEMYTKYKSQITKAGKNFVDKTCTLVILAIAWSPKVIAFDARTKDYALDRPHITIGTASGTPPKEAVMLMDPSHKQYKLVKQPIYIENQRLFASP